MKKRFPALVLGGILALGLLSGCGQKEAASSVSTAASEPAAAVNGSGQELVFVNYRDIRDLNPHLYAGEMYAQSILYDTLVSITEDGYEGCLAESWTISEDGKIYTFKIRDGVTFSDGTVCDANAILANFNAIIENKDRHTWLEMMNLLVGVSAPDDHTFVIELSEAYYPMLTELGCIRPFAMISPNCMINGSTKDGVSGYIGTGPYVLTDFETDQYAVFERNENYWGEKPEIERITVKVIPDNQTRIMALESGEIDLIFGKNMLDADAISQYVDSDKFEVALSDPTSTRHIVLNTTNEILSDTAVRQALQHATNRTAISEGIFYGLEQPADTLYAATVPYCDVELTPYEYSTETASSMLDEAGWIMGSSGIREKGGKKLELDLLYNSDSVTEKTISEYLQSEYLKLGISLNIHGEEEQSYRDNMKAGNFDMVFNICWGMPYDPQSSLAAMRAPVYGDFAAQQGLADKKEIDQAITDILTTTDEEERQELYRFVLTRLHEDAVYIPLTFECNKALYTKNLQGVHFGTDQYDVPFSDMYFE
ncbi:nickel ABC transporter substrate-binding protein [Enterocloster sp.]|uniref:nickel ABC transporter substrate-binding protein n=1 Tax=Enterocloster sp. TaxID=2719315 RepID=UPI003AB49ABD